MFAASKDCPFAADDTAGAEEALEAVKDLAKRAEVF